MIISGIQFGMKQDITAFEAIMVSMEARVCN